MRNEVNTWPALDQSGDVIRVLPLQVAACFFERKSTRQQRPATFRFELYDKCRLSPRMVCGGEQYIGVEKQPHSADLTAASVIRLRNATGKVICPRLDSARFSFMISAGQAFCLSSILEILTEYRKFRSTEVPLPDYSALTLRVRLL